MSLVTGRRNDPFGAWRLALTCTTLAFYLAVAVLPFEQLVLCIRPDGHVGLEVGRGSATCLDCGPSPEAGTVEDGCCSRSEEGSGDAPCRDVVVVQRQEEPGVRPADRALPDVPLAAPAPERSGVPAAIAASARAGSLRLEPSRPPPFRLALILRI